MEKPICHAYTYEVATKTKCAFALFIFSFYFCFILSSLSPFPLRFLMSSAKTRRAEEEKEFCCETSTNLGPATDQFCDLITMPVTSIRLL